MSDGCSCCGLTDAPLLGCDVLKSLRWEAVRDDWRSIIRSVLHSVACGDLVARSEAMSVVCCQLLPHIYTNSDLLPGREGSLCFTSKVEDAIRLAIARTCDLLIQERLDDATAELEFLQHCVTMLLQCGQSKPELCSSLCYQFSCLPTLSHLLTFCRDREMSSALEFQSLAPVLGSLFKSSYSLLKICLEGTERLTIDHTYLTHLLSMLTRLADVAITFDPSLILLCWKFLGKLIFRARSHLPNVIQTIQPIIEHLFITMETKTEECVLTKYGGDEGTRQHFVKLLKLCRFLSTLLVRIFSEVSVIWKRDKDYKKWIVECSRMEFDEIAADRHLCQRLLQTLLTIQTAIIKSGFHENQWQEFESNILLVREPLIQSLIHSPNFTLQLMNKEVVGENQHAAWALSLCTLMKLFHTLNDGMQDEVMGETTSREEDCHSCRLLDAAFHALHMSYVEIVTPLRVGGVMCNGQPQRMVTFYEHILTHLSALVLVLPDRHRCKLEHVLLRYMFAGDPHCSLMAGDTFVFLSIQAGPDATLTYAQHFSKLLLSIPTGHWQLASVIGRLVTHLPASHVQQLTTSFPIDQLSQLLPCLTSSGHLDTSQFHTCILDELSSELAAPRPNLITMRASLKTVCAVVSENTVLPPSLSPLPQLLLTLLTSFLPSSQLALQYVVPLLSGLDKFLHLHPFPQPLAIAIPNLLKCCGHLTLPQPARSEILRIITSIFQTLLCHESWLVQHLTLEAFKTFAEFTPYTEAVEKCIPKHLSDHVINFLHKVPYGQHSVSWEQLHTRLQQHCPRSETTPTASEATPHDGGVKELVDAWEVVSEHRQPSPELLKLLKQLCSRMQAYIVQHS